MTWGASIENFFGERMSQVRTAKLWFLGRIRLYRKLRGELELKTSKELAWFLRCSYVGASYMQDDLDLWVLLTQASVARSLNMGFGCRSRCHWTKAEDILLDDHLHITGSSLLRDLIRGFNKARTVLRFNNNGAVLPQHIIVEQLLLLFRRKLELTPEQERSVLGILKFHGIYVLGDLWRPTSGWKLVRLLFQSTRMTRQGDDVGLVWLLGKIYSLPPWVVGLKLQDSNGWAWQVGNKQVHSWTFLNNIWNSLLASPRTDFVKINRRWWVDFIVVGWIRFWKRVQGSLSFYYHKICISRVLNHGFFHHHRAFIQGVHFGACPYYTAASESIVHLFYGCKNLQHKWTTIGVILVGTPLAPIFCQDSLWRIICTMVLRSRRSLILLIVVVEMLSVFGMRSIIGVIDPNSGSGRSFVFW